MKDAANIKLAQASELTRKATKEIVDGIETMSDEQMCKTVMDLGLAQKLVLEAYEIEYRS